MPEGSRPAVSLDPVPELQAAMRERNKLCAEGYKLWAEGYKLYAEGYRLCAEGYRLCAEGDKLCAEGDKLCAEGEGLWTEAVIAVFGPREPLDWSRWPACIVRGVRYA